MVTTVPAEEAKLLERIRSTASSQVSGALTEHLDAGAAQRLWVASADLSDADFARAMGVADSLAMRSFGLNNTSRILHAGARDPEVVRSALARLVRRAEAACALSPLVGRLEEGLGVPSVKTRVRRMAESVAERFAWEPIDSLMLRGYTVLASRGFNIVRWSADREDDYRALGERFDALAAHWDRFRHADEFDWELIGTLEEAPSPVAVGAL